MSADTFPAFHPRLVPDLRALLEAAQERGDDWLETDALLADAVRARATDIHLDPQPEGLHVRLRIDGRVIDVLRLDGGNGARLINQFKVLAGLDPMPPRVAVEGSFSWLSREQGGTEQELFFRVTAVTCVAGEKLAVRFLAPPKRFRDTLSLGVGEQGARDIRHWMDATGGMLLVAGPTGAGKTTTLYTLLNQLRLRDSQVITLEEPVEFELPGVNQIQVDADSGRDVLTGTRSLLRLDPDYVLIGELRDPLAAHAALNVSSSGRSLMATLHSRDSVGVVSMLRQLEVSDGEIAANLGLVVAQRLVRRLCPHCRTQRPLSSRDREWLEAAGATVPELAWMPTGCERCDGLGFRGRVGVFEIWQPSASDRARIRDHGEEAQLRRAVIERGVPLLFADGLSKAEVGTTSLREVMRMGAMLAA